MILSGIILIPEKSLMIYSGHSDEYKMKTVLLP